MGNPAPEARKRVQGGLNPQSCAALWAAEGSMESDAFYSVRGLLWKVPRRRREEGAGRIESAIMRRPVGGGGFYGKRCVL